MPRYEPKYETVSFLSDYGLADEFAGVVRSVIRDLAPHAAVIDLTHQIPAHDIRAGSLALARCIQYVPAGVVLAVVDPGVGTARRAVAVEIAGGAGVIVAPDNGLMAPAVAMAGGLGAAVDLTNADYHLVAPGATFAGRDIFAPVAAHLCNGVPLAELGESIDPAVLVPGVIPVPRHEGSTVVAEVLWVDHFGNAQLNLGPDDVAGWDGVARLRWGDDVRTATVAATFDEIGQGAIGLVLDSYGLLAVSLMRRSAADELGLAAGDEIRLSPAGSEEGGGLATPVALRPSGRPAGSGG